MTLSRALKSVGIALAVLAVAIYVGYFAIYVTYAVNLFQWPFDYDQGEGFELYDAILYSQGKWPYRDNATFPYYASNYPPLFHLLIVPLLPLFGPRLIAGRLVSFIATLVTGGAIFAILRRHVNGWLIPMLSALAFFASNYVYQLGPLCRMHMTMVMFETLAIGFIAHFEHPQHGRRNLILGLAMLLFAGYAKQMAIFTVVAALGYVFLRDVKKAFLAGLALTIVAGVIFWLINVATDGQWWINTIQANVNEFDYRQSIFLFGQWFRLHAVLILLAGGYFIYELFWGRLSAYSLWFFLALGMGALSGKWGAGFGYFTTAIAATCVLSGLALGRLKTLSVRQRPLRRAFRRLAASAALSRLSLKRFLRRARGVFKKRPALAPALVGLIIPVLYLIQAPRMLHLPTTGPVFGPLARTLGVDQQLIQGDCTTFQYHDTMGYTQLGHLMTASDHEAGQEILDHIRTADGIPFSEEAMFSILTDNPVVTNPTQLLNLYKNDLLDTTALVEDINQQRFGVVIFRAQFYPHPVLEAIGQNYKPVDHVCMNGFYYHILWPLRRLDDASAAP